MAHRQIVLDTETTGIDPKQGHRIIEIGCVELVNRRLTGNNFHVYINPQREIEEEAIDVHGITNEFLRDKPLYHQIAHEFLEYIRGAELVIHNAAFDIGHMDNEFALLNQGFPNTADVCSVLDTLKWRVTCTLVKRITLMRFAAVTILITQSVLYTALYWIPRS